MIPNVALVDLEARDGDKMRRRDVWLDDLKARDDVVKISKQYGDRVYMYEVQPVLRGRVLAPPSYYVWKDDINVSIQIDRFMAIKSYESCVSVIEHFEKLKKGLKWGD